MASLNRHDIIGNLGKDPEIRYTQTNQMVANFSVATSEKYKDKSGNQVESTEWHNVVAWGKLAEIVQNYLKKGSKVFISGKSQTRQWEDKEGVTRYTTEINARDMVMLSFKDGETSRNEPQQGVTVAQVTEMADGVPEQDDDDLPFAAHIY